MLIDEGLPQSWPNDVLVALAKFKQGDLVENPPFFYFADPAKAIWEMTRRYAADSEGPEIVEATGEAHPPFGMVTTQTCDILEVDPSRLVKPWIQIVPVYEAETIHQSKQKQIHLGRIPYLIHLPALDGFWVADLRIEFPFEKSWLAGRDPIAGFENEVQRQEAGERIGWVRSRPALAERFVSTVQRPLINSLKELRGTDADLFARLNEEVAEVAVEMDSRLDPTRAQLLILTESALDDSVKNWFETWWDSNREAAERGGIALLPLGYPVLDSLPASFYRSYLVLPFGFLTPD